jgi:hypothetical protein
MLNALVGISDARDPRIYGLIFAFHRFRIQNSATIVAFYLHIQFIRKHSLMLSILISTD